MAIATIVLSATVVHAGIFRYSLIQDDWIRLGWVLVPDKIQMLIDEFSPFEKAEYRPFGAFYFLLVAYVFKMNAVLTHAVALTVHCLNAVLAALVLFRITRDALIGWAAGALYASAVLIHMDPLLWASGIFDLGSVMSALLAIWLFIRGRVGWSAAAYAAGLLFKESISFLPAVLATLAWTAQDRPGGSRARMLRLLHRMWPFAVVFALHLGLKLAGESPLEHADGHPYALRFTGPHVIANLLTYSRWSVGALMPTYTVSSTIAVLAVAGVALVLVALGRVHRMDAGFQQSPAAIAVLTVWLVAALGLIPFLPNHVYKNYLMLALPAILALVLIAFRLVCAQLRLPGRIVWTVSTVLVLLSVISSGVYFRNIDRLGLNQPFIEGTNDLIRRGAMVLAVRDGLDRARPSLPPRSVLLFKGVDVWAFGKDAGPRIWYRDPTIRADDARFLARDASGWVLVDPVESQVETYTGAEAQRIQLNCCPVYLFELTDGGLVERPLSTISPGGEGAR